MKFQDKTKGGYPYEILGVLDEPYMGDHPIVGKVYNDKCCQVSWTKDGKAQVLYQSSYGDETLTKCKDFDLVPKPEYFWVVKPRSCDCGRIYKDSNEIKCCTGEEIFKVVRIPNGMEFKFVSK